MTRPSGRNHLISRGPDPALPALDRRHFVLAGLTAALTFTDVGRAAADAATFNTEIKRLEAVLGGRLGVSVIDMATGTRFGQRGGERFPLASTFKLLAAAAVLQAVDQARDSLDRRVRYAAVDLVTHSPETQNHVADGLTLREICAAAITLSDNTAGNLLLAAIGGPAGLTQFARRLGDPATRLDRIEPALNEALPGDPRDTTTPDNMADNLRRLIFGDVLSEPARQQLARWMAATTTGAAKLRAGIPADWAIGDKTGGAKRGAMADVAILTPPDRAPLIAAVYVADTAAHADTGNATIAGVGRAIAAHLAR